MTMKHRNPESNSLSLILTLQTLNDSVILFVSETIFDADSFTVVDPSTISNPTEYEDPTNCGADQKFNFCS